MLGFVRTDDNALVACLGDPQRTVAAYRVLTPALAHLASDPDPQVRARAAELAGKFAHTDRRAVTALQAAHRDDPSPAVRKKAGWYTPGGAIYERTTASASR